MDLTTAASTGAILDRNTTIDIMRRFTITCVVEAARRVGLPEDQALQIESRGFLDSPGRYRQTSYKQIGGLTPFFKRFQPSSVIFDRAMLGTHPSKENDWLTAIRINTEPQGEDSYRITGVLAGLLRWGSNGIDIQDQIVTAAEEAWAEAGDTLLPLNRAEVGDHMWGVKWQPHELKARTDEQLTQTIGRLMAALLPVLRDVRRSQQPRMGPVLFPRFEIVTGGTAGDSYGALPATGSYQFTFRSYERDLLAPHGRRIECVALDRPVTLNVNQSSGGSTYSTSCDGGFETIRELGSALNLRHGDHARMTIQPDGRWKLEQAEPPAILVKLGTIRSGVNSYDGPATLAVFADYLEQHPFVWFGVRNSTGIRDARMQEYRSAIARGIPVLIYFSAGTSGGGTGDVMCVGRLDGVESSPQEIPRPGPETPTEMSEVGTCRIWLRLSSLTWETIPLHEFVLEDKGTPVERNLRSPMVYVRRIGVRTAHRPELELIASSTSIGQHFDQLRQFIALHGAAYYPWMVGIRPAQHERLQHRGFWLNIYTSGGRGEVTHRLRVESVVSTDDASGIMSPELDLTPDLTQGGKAPNTTHARTWFKVTEGEELLESLPLFAFVDYDSGDPIQPETLVNAFGFVRRVEVDTGPDPDPEPIQVRGLLEILQAFDESDLTYHRDDIINLHHALHALPHKHFVILHGVSGTGKSQFAQAYANALYGRHPLTEPGNLYYRIISVQPTWQDRTALLGYYNPLTESYEVPPFLGHLLQAVRNPSAKYVICLDEMNLAVVEHYFADFLSAWESREPIVLHHHPGVITHVPTELAVPPNLLVIGTVNIDETTHGFSPKVLDRAFTVELTHVDIQAFGKTFLRRCQDQAQRESLDRAVSLLEQVHGILAPYGLHFAYRTAGEVLSFLLTNAEASDALDEGRALDLMLHQKVLPRLRGDDRLLPMLTALGNLLAGQPWGSGSRSKTVIDRMIQEAEQYGTFQYWR